MEQVKTLLNVDGLNKVIGDLQAANAALATKVGAQEQTIAALQKSDDEKVAETLAPRAKPLAWGFQASTAKETVMTDDEKAKLKDAKPTGWVAEALSPLMSSG